MDWNIDIELIILTAIVQRANREALWDMALKEIDLKAMTEEIIEDLQQTEKIK